MGGAKQVPGQAGFKPESTGLLNPDQTLRMLALSSTHADLSLEALGVEALHHATFLQLPLGVGYATREGAFIWCNEAFDRMLGLDPGEHKNKSIRELTHVSDRDSNAELLDELWEGRRESYTQDKRYVRRDGTDLWVRVTAAMVRTPEGEPVCTVGFLEDISARKQMEFEVERAQKALMDASRQAGMAEVATNVLHNVGNVLNSVNVSASLVADRIKQSKSARIGDVAALLDQHRADLPAFFASDARAQKVPQYLVALAAQLKAERDALLQELTGLKANLDHIKDAVTMQQAYARRCGVLESVGVVDLVEDSLRMNAGALTRHQVTLKRDFRAKPEITVDKHKVLQILVNLVRNAKYACDESGRPEKQVTVRIEADGAAGADTDTGAAATAAATGTVRIAVIDNGIGIAPEVMGRLFTHGFTTRQSGHGFGLHSAALAATELGGRLTAASDGLGRGATFELTLPLKPPERADG